MPHDIQSLIKQTKPFSSKEEELYLNLVRTLNQLQREFTALFKKSDLSNNQYNILRILRGTGDKGLTCGEIGERMITRDPDITRLLDRLVKRGLAQRLRESEDRRVVTSRITEAGLLLLQQLDKPVIDLHKKQLSHIDAKTQDTLIQIFENVRVQRSADTDAV